MKNKKMAVFKTFMIEDVEGYLQDDKSAKYIVNAIFTEFSQMRLTDFVDAMIFHKEDMFRESRESRESK